MDDYFERDFLLPPFTAAPLVLVPAFRASLSLSGWMQHWV
jgi:hypothetical protein